MINSRTCIACRQKSPQQELIRLARPKSGGVVLGPKGPGRGVYLCSKKSCLDQLVQNPNKMKHFLQVAELPKEAIAALFCFIAPKTVGEVP